MADRPNIKEILAAARRGGAAKPTGEAAADAEPVAPAVEEVEAAPSPAPVAAKPASAPLGRTLTLKEKLAAARSGGAATPGVAPAPTAAAPVETPTEESAAQPPPRRPRPPPCLPLRNLVVR